MNQRFYRYYLIAFGLLLFLPLIQQIWSPIKLAGLQGAFDKGKPPVLSASSWLKGTYQQSAEYYLKYNTAFNGELVRFRNQVDYSLFGNINTNLVLGKENYLFDPSYQAALEGTDLMSDSALKEKKLNLQKTLAILNSLDVPVLICFAPNKAGYYEDYLPNKLLRASRTNKTIIDSLLKSQHVPSIDFDSWFLASKEKSPYALIPKYGAHWTTYGAALAADSLLNKISTILKRQISSIRITNTVVSNVARFADDDYLPQLNLMKKWLSPDLAYPSVEFNIRTKPDVLIISDSFIWNLYDLNVIQNCFATKSLAAYYFKTLYDSKKTELGPVPTLKKNHLSNHDIILIITSDPGLTDFGYGFFEATAKLVQNN